MPATAETDHALGIAIPSRIHFPESSRWPLNGWRIAVKDNYNLQGTRTSICNRAFHDFYPPHRSTARCLQALQSVGVQILGKLHLSSFALKEDPAECVDYQVPFNPRADGYQTPAGSSSGSSAATASNDFLDITLATDSKSSEGELFTLAWILIQWKLQEAADDQPSGMDALPLRPFTGRVSCEGIMPLFKRIDSPSIMGRNLGGFSKEGMIQSPRRSPCC